MSSFFFIFHSFLKKSALWYIIAIFLVILGFALEFSAPYFYKNLSVLFFSGFSSENQHAILQILYLYIAVAVGQWTVWRVFDFYIAKKTYLLPMKSIENWAFSILMQQNFDFFQNSFSGSLVKKIGKMIRSYEAILDWFLFSFLNLSIHLTIAILLLSLENLFVGMIFLAWVVLYIMVTVLYSLWQLQFIEEAAVADSAMGGKWSDLMGNIMTVFSFSSFSYEQKKIKEGTQDVFEKKKKAWYLSYILFSIQGAMFWSIEIYMLFYFYNLWQIGQFPIALFVLFQTIYIPISWNIWTFGKTIRGLFNSIGDLKEFEEIINALPPQNPKKIQDITDISPTISFQNIFFAYSEQTPLFENFSLDIAPQEKIGIVGHSGSGKTTLIKMIFDFIQPQKGEIFIGDYPMSTSTSHSIRQQFSLVSQSTDLFHRTLRENIAYDTNATDDQIWKAVQSAQCEDFITALPKGLDTYVGERGVKLSGGERQRVSLARAFLRNTPFIVLDEPTSALDSLTEAKIQTAITQLLKNKTAIVIAHRLSTIYQMDRIIVLEAGEIIESGNHEELLTLNGKYAQMWSHQQGGFLVE